LFYGLGGDLHPTDSRAAHRRFGRANAGRVVAHDLKVLFRMVAKEPQEVVAADMLGLITAPAHRP
jgi:hypothetical protein